MYSFLDGSLTHSGDGSLADIETSQLVQALLKNVSVPALVLMEVPMWVSHRCLGGNFTNERIATRLTSTLSPRNRTPTCMLEPFPCSSIDRANLSMQGSCGAWKKRPSNLRWRGTTLFGADDASISAPVYAGHVAPKRGLSSRWCA